MKVARNVTPNSTICCDANIVVFYATNPDATEIHNLWAEWIRKRLRVIAPSLLGYEVANAMHRLNLSGHLSEPDASDALNVAMTLPIELIHDRRLHESAHRMARQFNRPTAYDVHYLALAQRETAVFWTADAKLHRAVAPELDWVQLVAAPTRQT